MSTADKLNKLIDTKSRLKEAITTKGVIVDTEVFAEYPSRVLAITSGGGGGGEGKAPALTFPSPFIMGATYANGHSDTELIPGLSLSNMAIVDNNSRITGFSRVDALNFTITCDALQNGDLIEVQLLPTAFVNLNGTSNKVSKLISDIVDIAELLDTVSGATYVVNSSSYIDSGTYTIPMSTEWWQQFANNATVSADGVVNIGSFSMSINARDSSVYQICYATYKLSEDVTVQKIRWYGLAHYSTVSTAYAWELYLLSNGAAMLYLSNQPTDYFNGAFSFTGLSYSINEQNNLISFYPTTYSRKEYDIVSSIVDTSRNLEAIPDVYLFDDLLNDRYYMAYVLWNTYSDDTTYSTSILPWQYDGSEYTSIILSGNSYIGIGSNTEHIKLNRRDTSVHYIFKQTGKVNVNGVILDFTKIRWQGYSFYNQTSEAYLQIWDLYLFSNGDAMIQLINKPTSSWDGTFSFFGAVYTVSANEDIVSFYRQNVEGTSWTVVSGLYDATLSLNLIN